MLSFLWNPVNLGRIQGKRIVQNCCSATHTTRTLLRSGASGVDPVEQMYTGHLHKMDSRPSTDKKEDTHMGCLLFSCGQQDSNLHAYAVEPKSTESTNSTMPAHSGEYFIMYSGGCQSKDRLIFSPLNCTKYFTFALDIVDTDE